MKDIPLRYLHYFDIEANGKKPIYADLEYRKRLEKAVNVIINLLREKFDLGYCALLKTGRGVSLYYKFKPIDISYENRFKEWIKNTIYPLIEKEFKKHELLYNKKENEYRIKAWDSVFDSARINGAPLSYHTKYQELPKRKVLKINEFIINNDIVSILNSVVFVRKKANSNKKSIGKYRNSLPKNISKKHKQLSFTETQEFKILSQYQNIPEGDIKRCIIFPLKMFCRDYDPKHYGALVTELNRLGYEGEHNIPTSEYEYSQSVFRNWCYDNYKWCIKNNFKVKYKLMVNKRQRIRNDPKLKTQDYNKKLGTMKEVIKFVFYYNKNNSYIDHKQQIVVNWDSLWKQLETNVEPLLIKFIQKNKLFEELKFLGVDSK
jgi:hypothetical protein